MMIKLTPTEIGTALAEGQGHELMTLLATLASHEDADELITAAALHHNGSDLHRMTAPWLRQLADALEAVEARDSAVDAAGRVA